MLYLASAAELGPFRGVVVRVELSPLGPSPRLLREHAIGAITGAVFARRYLRELHRHWERDPQPFLDLLTLTGGDRDCTLVDAWADQPQAPRRVLAAALQQIAATHREEARRRTHRRRET